MKELLERAAAAAGLRVYRTHEDGLELADAGQPYDWKLWNPTIDDGDALRLAVALRLKLTIGNGIVMAERLGCTDVGEQLVNHNGDRLAATRMAIVRAASAGPMPFL